MTRILLSVLFLIVILPAARMTAQGDCVGHDECYDLPNNPKPRVADWPADDRLNPVPDEYYTLYCEYDLVHVWAGVPSAQNIANIPISRIEQANSSPFDAGNGLAVFRVDDTITITGANGNGPSHPGAKSFSLFQCLERNGNPALLVTPTTTPVPPGVSAPPPTPIPQTTTEITERVGETCYVVNYADGTQDTGCTPWTGAEWVIHLVGLALVLITRSCSGNVGLALVMSPGVWWALESRFRKR